MNLVAQTDDPELWEWLNNAHFDAGSFVSSLAKAGLLADGENYPVLRPVLEFMRAKYPQYNVKRGAVAEEKHDL
jgi:hypothetical protein